MMKRFLALVLTLILVFSVCPESVLATGINETTTAASDAETTDFFAPKPADTALRVEVQRYSQVNPLYADLVSENNLLASDSVMLADEAVYCTSIPEAAEVLREGMKARKNSVVVQLRTRDTDVIKDIFDAALEHTGNPTEGDYLRWHYLQYTASGSGYPDGNMVVMTYEYVISYHTTAEQETAVNAAVSNIIAPLQGLSDYEKVCGIYDWLTANVKYDENLTDYSTYGALVDKSCVCQGYASAFYRLALELGIDCRLISGFGNDEEHGWNIVKLNEEYYNVDATWDAGLTSGSYRYFLKCNNHFSDHIRNDEYDTASFNSMYPMSKVDYTDTLEHTPGEAVAENKVAATCEENGSYERVVYCSVCDAELSRETVTVKATGHSYGDWTAEGNQEVRTCSACGKREKRDTEKSENPFIDVGASEYYHDAVLWAVEQEITNGYGSEFTFCPELVCTRGEVVTFLWRAAGKPEPESGLNNFTDVKQGDYFYKAVLWAVERGITNGYGSDTVFNPNGSCTRGQVATFLWRYSQEPQPTKSSNPFTDVKKSDYFYTAVLWAVEEGVTYGYGNSYTFAPELECTRGQIVTFLYRAMN